MDAKICTRCETNLPLSSFYKRGDSDRYRSKCKVCTNDRAKELYPKRQEYHKKAVAQYYYQHREEAARYAIEYRKTDKGKEVIKRATKKWYDANRHKKLAHWRVSDAKQRGALIQENCAKCDDEKTEAHHEDYSKPLEVIWLCKKCHGKVHSKYEHV